MEPGKVHPKDRRKQNIQKVKEKNESTKGMLSNYQTIA
jgi:hypothetical protein